jgi:hypothetical protein
MGERWQGVKAVAAAVIATLRDPRRRAGSDPVALLRDGLADPARLGRLEDEISRWADETVSAALAEVA